LRRKPFASTTIIQVVDVEQEHAFHLSHRRINISRHSDVHQAHGAILPLLSDAFRFLATKHGVRARGGTDQDVCLQHVRPAVVKRNCGSTQLLGQFNRVLQGSIYHVDGSGALIDEVSCRKLAHFPGPEEQHFTSFD
jgi:hypothetical protein